VPQGLKLCKLCDVAMGIKTYLSAWVHLTGEAPSLRQRPNFSSNGWLGEVERDILPLDLMRTTVSLLSSSDDFEKLDLEH
jgi:hypothetical protein